jgi:membrane-anchored glycerophosphoryl diester phosphodiesterase (GDPDase)
MAFSQPQGNNDLPTSLLPRYRRLLSVGAVLDESIQLFRQHWITLALYGLVALIPSWVLTMLAFAGGFQSSLIAPSLNSDVFPFVLFGGLLVLSLLSGLCALLWSTAATFAAYFFMRGQAADLKLVYLRALGRFGAMLLGSLVFVLLFLGLFALSLGLIVITLFGVLGTLVAAIGLIVWATRPHLRRPWLKWLIILTTPFGLATYYGVRWSLFIPAVVLEGQGPVDALRRSFRLTEHEWFRAWAVLTLATVIVVVLVSVPITLVDLIFGVVMPSYGASAADLLQMVNTTVTTVCQVLFSSIATITYVVLFVDLRNRREGTDLSERIGSLEAATP